MGAGDFVLFESASGYALCEVVEFEEIGSTTKEVQETVGDLKRFSRCVKLKAFCPFESAEQALANINAISEHIVPDELKDFLELQLPSVKKSSKKSKDVTLGLVDPNFASAVQEATSFPCKSSDVVREILRGVRMHLSHFIKELANGNIEQAQLGLGHSYSRAKVKFNVNRSDNMIIQAICILDQLDKDINTFAMRVKEWYSWHFPELAKLVPDIFVYARAVDHIKDKSSLNDSAEKIAELTEIVLDEDVV